jgi:hypothetical protein
MNRTPGIETKGRRAADPPTRLRAPIPLLVRRVIVLRRRTERGGAANRQTHRGARDLKAQTAARRPVRPTEHQAGGQGRSKMDHDADRRLTLVRGPDRPKTLRMTAARGTTHKDKRDRDKMERGKRDPRKADRGEHDRGRRARSDRNKRDRAATQRMLLDRRVLQLMQKIAMVKSQPPTHKRDQGGVGGRTMRTSLAANPRMPTITTRRRMADRMAQRMDFRERLAQMAL